MTAESDDTAGHPASEARCISCDRYIGPAGSCPYCGSEARRPLSLRLLRLGALAVGIGGLAGLWLFAAGREAPVVAIGDIAPVMNFAPVAVEGRVPRAPTVRRSYGRAEYVGFTIDDGTGAIRATLYGRAAREAADSGRLPAAGARVRVGGTLDVSAAGDPRLRVHSVGQISPAGPAPALPREAPRP